MDIIGLDLDSVIGNTEIVLDKYLKEKYDFETDWSKVTNYAVETIPGISQEIANETLHDIYNGDLLFNILPYEYVNHALNKLHNEGFRIVIITSRPLNLQVKTMEWLEKYNLTYDLLYHVKSDDKYRIISTMGIKSFVEDRPDIIDSILYNCGVLEYGLYIINHPWNSNYNNEYVIKVNYLYEAVDKIVEYRKWRNFFVHRCQGNIEKFIKEYYDGKDSM